MYARPVNLGAVTIRNAAYSLLVQTWLLLHLKELHEPNRV